MSKHVFKANEIVRLNKKVMIESPRLEIEVPDEIEHEEIDYAAILQEEKLRAGEFREKWEQEKQAMIAQAHAEAERIVRDAEQLAFDEVKAKKGEQQKLKIQLEDEARIVLAEAKAKAAELEAEIQAKTNVIEQDAYTRGFKEGHEQGFQSGKEEVGRLIERLHLIITRAIEKRNEIIEESETQLINLVLLIAQKVIKVISENQKNVVVNNVIQALRKLKGRGDVTIRVNMADLELASSHRKFFQEKVEHVKNITILEDSSVEKGGCIIETDFGQIDARISAQLNELETRIMEMMPIRTITEQKGAK